ncbi:MAG: DUF1272 domain-containing protein [Bacteroidetes bacterium]|nr:DUF1272 domain-containing protein [Bacteroidota bacterium]MCH8246535.1 DUF1272 domain-containing protein [Bacteroidota bacterium]MCZ6705390.1 DUF1272 domain-containing protein [Bacteroidota bacterium]
MTLDMRPNCERCGTDLSMDAEAYICSYECTYCPDCSRVVSRRCPNCEGELVRRPLRVKEVIPD